MKPKVTDEQIINEIKKLDEIVRRDFEVRGFQKGFNPGHRREVIQRAVCGKYNITYTDSGFRSRLKKLTKEKVLRKFKIGEGLHSMTFYKLRQATTADTGTTQ